MPLPSSPNTLHFGGLADNNESASKDSISLQAYSRIFSEGSEVGDVDGDGTGDQPADRTLLNTAPYALSKFYDAHIPNDQFGSVVSKLVDGTAVTSNGYVDGEAGRIYWTITEDPAGSTTYTGGLKYKSDASVAASSTLAFDGTGTKYVTIAAPSTTQQIGSPYKYYSFVSTAEFKNAVGADLSHYDQLSGGSVNSSATSHTLDASSETNALTIAPVVSVGTQASYSTSTSTVTAGDNQGISISGANVTMTGAGVTQITVTHIGNPTQARNSTTSTENITVTYNRAIESLTLVTSATVNYGGNNVTISAISEGVQQNNFHVGYDDNNTSGDTSFTSLYDNVTSLYVRTTVSKTFTAPAGSYYIKAMHTGDGSAVIGASLIVAPTFVYSTIGNSANISVNGTSHRFYVTSATGNNIAITISNNLNGTTTTDYSTGYTLAPGAADGIYTVTYTGLANYSQPNNQTDTVNVYPDANYSVTDTTLYTNAPAGSGLSNDSLAVTSTSVGSNISTYAYTITKDGDGEFEETFGTANISVSSGDIKDEYGAGTYNIELIVTGGGSLSNTETGDNDFTVTNYDPQALTITAPISVHIARRGTTSAVAWVKTSATAVTIKSYKGGVAVDTLSAGNTGLSHTWSPDSGDTLGSDWTIYGSVDGGSVSDHSSQFTLKDGIALSPDLNSPVAGNGSATISWSDGLYNGGGNYVYIYTNAGSYIATSTQPGTSYAWPYDSNNKYTVKFKVSGVNLSGEEGDKSAFSSAVIIYPDLTGHNDIVCSGTVYSTTNNSSGTTKAVSVTDTTNNVTSYTYSITSGGGSISPSGLQTATSIGAATYTAAAAGSVVLRLTVNGDLSQTGDYTEATITSILYPKIYSISTTAGSGTATIYNDTNFYVNWQGFTLDSVADWITFKLYDDDNNLEGTITKYGNQAQFTSGGSTTSAGQYYHSSFGSLSTNYGINTADNYYFRVEAFDGGVSKGYVDTSQFAINVPTNISINCEEYDGAFYGGYTSLLNAADTTATLDSGTKSLWYSGGSLSNGVDFHTTNTLASGFDGDPQNNDSNIFYSYGANCFEVTDAGAIAQIRSRTPGPIGNPTAVANGTDDIYLSIPSSNTIVTRNIRVRSDTAIGGYTERTISPSQSATYSNSNISMKSLFGASLAGGATYVFDIQGENDDGYVSGYTSTTSATTVSNTITSVSASPSSWEYGASGDVTISYTKNFTDAITIAMFEGYTTYQTKTNVGSGVTGATSQTFTKNWVTAVGASNWLDFKFSYYSSGTLISTTFNLAKAVEVTIPAPAPEVTATNGTSTSYCEVSWTTPSNTNDGYSVYRSDSSGGTYNLLNTDSASPYYDTTGAAGTVFYYKVKSKRTTIAYTGGSSAVPRSVYSERSDYDAGWKATGGVCFAMDTKIMLSDGTEKEIQYLEMSDKLMGMKMSDMPTHGKSADEWHTYSGWTTSSIDSFETCEVSIETLEHGNYREYYKITTEDKVLKATFEHPIFVLRDGTYQWSQVQDLQETDKIVNYKNEVSSINNIELIEESLEAYTIDVEIEDVYFAEGLLVHNGEEKG